MNRYSGESRILVAVDCIIFGFDGTDIKLLIVQRSLKPEKGKWSLMGGFLQAQESLEQAANRILKKLTGLEGVYLEQLKAFGEPDRDPVERTLSIAYFALIDIHQYEKQLSNDYHAEWVHLHKMPELIFDHKKMVEIAKKQLRYKAALHPILFELLPAKFTIPQLQNLYEGIYDATFRQPQLQPESTLYRTADQTKRKGQSQLKKRSLLLQIRQTEVQGQFPGISEFYPQPG
jgi:8-oxo-dGTP diphosphatase